MTSLPEWMRADPPAVVATALPRRPNIARRTLNGFARLLEATLADEATAARPGLLQRIDARAKIIALLGLLVLSTFVHTLPALLLLYAVCCALAWLSRLPRKRLTGVWLLVPLFTAVFMLPAALNVLTAGKPLLTLWHFAGGSVLAITDHGLYAVARLVLRAAVCIALAVLLTATTRTHRLLYGLRVLGVPQLFVMLLAMMERYLLVLVRAAAEIHLGKISRSPLPGTLRQEQSWVAAGVGSLFRRTQALGDAVYLAMLARGYTGRVRLLGESRWQRRDWLFLAAALPLTALLLYLG